VRITPARRKRRPAYRNGGSVWTAIAMARYVEPQTTYTMARANQTFRLEARGD